MELPSTDQASVAIAAVYGAFEPSGGLDDLQTSVLESIALGLFGLDLQAEPVAPLTVDEFLAVSEQPLRHQAVNIMTVLEMVATPLLPEAADGVTRYAAKLGIDHG